MNARLAELEAEKAGLVVQQARSEMVPNIAVHPNLAAVYRRKVEELETLLEDAQHKDEAMELIRSLIEKIELTPREEGGLAAVLHGDMARILVLCSAGSFSGLEAAQQNAFRAVGAEGLQVSARSQVSRQAKTLAGVSSRWL